MKAPDLLTAALEYNQHGWPVIPVGQDKRPCCNWGHWRRRPQTEDEVRGFPWARLHGLAPLTWPATDLIVLDFDGPHAEKVWREQTGITLLATATTHTPSGGTHRIYKVPPGTRRPGTVNGAEPRRKIRLVADPNCGCAKPCGVDLLLNGYFVAPPTPGYREDPDHPFEPGCLATIPQAVLDLARKNEKQTPERASSDGQDDWFEQAWAGVPEGQRDDTAARMAGYYLHITRGDQEATFRAMRLWANQCKPPFPEAELRKVIKSIAARETAKAGGGPVLVNLADVKIEAVSWLWPGRLPLGKLSLFIGDPDGGKTNLLLDAMARVTTERRWPDGSLAPCGNVVLLTAEDGLADTIKPRLVAMGGDPARVHVLTGIGDPDRPRLFSLADDLAHLEEAIDRTAAVLVGIDPVSAYMGGPKVNTFRDSDVRAVLTPVAALAERKRVAVVGVMHLTKDQARQVIHRAQGNVSFVAAARAVFAVALDPDDPGRRLFLKVKLNIAEDPPGMGFRLVGETVLTDTGEPASVSRVEWDTAPVTVDVNTALGAPESPAEHSEREEAAEFLRDVLAGGPVAADELKKQARGAGIADRTLFRAKAELGVKAQKTGFRGGWVWSLSPKAAKPATSAYSGNGGNLGNLRTPETPAEVKL